MGKANSAIFWMGIQTLTNCRHRVDGGDLDPCSLVPKRGAAQTITGRGQEPVFPSAFCLLPSAFLDKIGIIYTNILSLYEVIVA